MFDPEKFVEEKIRELKQQIDGKAVIGVSGGVDSTVAAVLASRAVGDRLVAVYVDTGFMRKSNAPRTTPSIPLLMAPGSVRRMTSVC